MRVSEALGDLQLKRCHLLSSDCDPRKDVAREKA